MMTMQAKAIAGANTSEFRLLSKSAVRVKRAEFYEAAAVKPDGLNVCLECWKLYMCGDDRDLSASRMILGGGTAAENEAYKSDIYADQRNADMKIGEATDAMISSLRAIHGWAIKKKCGITSVWNFHGAEYLNTLLEAEEQLTTKLRNNIATATQF